MNSVLIGLLASILFTLIGGCALYLALQFSSWIPILVFLALLGIYTMFWCYDAYRGWPSIKADEPK